MPTVKTVSWESQCLPHVRILGEDGEHAATGMIVLWNKIDDYVLRYMRGLPAGLGVVGNLRTPIGINWLIRGLYRFNKIGTLVVWGRDYAMTGEGLLQLWQKGVTPEGRVPVFGWKLDPQVVGAIDELRRDVKLVDLRSVDIKDLAAEIGQLPYRQGERYGDLVQTMDITLPDTLPARATGLNLHAGNVGEAWVKLLNGLMQYGDIRGTRKEETIRHFFHVSATFPLDEQEVIHPYFDGFDERLLNRYWENFFSPLPPDPGVDYRYGERLQSWRGHNQLEELIARLKKKPASKRASISLLDAADLEGLEDAPCYALATFVIDEERWRLHSSHVYRSHDMFEGWPLNVYAIMRLHRYVAKRLGLHCGNFTIASQNAQIYERHWEAASAKIKQWQADVRRGQEGDYLFEPDPVGNFHFDLEGGSGMITCRLTSPAGDELLWETTDSDPFAIVHRIAEEMPFIDAHHLLYLGSEARKLRLSQTTGAEYVQD